MKPGTAKLNSVRVHCYQLLKIVYERGDFWVKRNRNGYTVYRSGITHSKADSTYTLDADGLSIAIARCNYLSARTGTARASAAIEAPKAKADSAEAGKSPTRSPALKPGYRCACNSSDCPENPREACVDDAVRLVTVSQPTRREGISVPMCQPCAQFHEAKANAR
jgi:hypothetical protein